MLYISSNKARCWSKRCLMVFTIYGHGSHLGRLTQLISSAPINFHIPVPNSLYQSQVGQRDNCQKKSMVSLFRGRKGWLSGGVGGWGVWEGCGSRWFKYDI